MTTSASPSGRTAAPLDLFALGTHSDWVASSGVWGKPGHQRIADFTKAAGISRLYWRTHDGGQAAYPSEVCSVMDGQIFRDPNFNGYGTLPKSDFAYATHIDYSKWDQLADMIEIGTATGLEVCQWYTFFEDDHGGIVPSEFIQKNPQYRCTLRSGEQLPGCLDFWYPEVREYKLAVIRELLQRPGKRLLLDVLRRNGLPSADVSGHFQYGHNPEIVAGFYEETGLKAGHLTTGTPEWNAWLDYNARPLTDFFRQVHQLTSAAGVAVDLLVWPVPSKEWLAFDLPEVTREGLVNDILIGSHRYAVSGAEARRQVEALEAQVEGGRARLAPGMFGYDGLVRSQVDAFAEAAAEAGCSAVVLHESNQVVASPISDGLKSWRLGVPNVRREVRAAPSPAKASVCCGLLSCYGSEVSPDQETQFEVCFTQELLTIKVVCAERNPAGLLPVPDVRGENYNAAVLGDRLFWNPYESVHVFLDPLHSHEDYRHFCLDPSGQGGCGSRLEEDWSAPWRHEVRLGEKEWAATFFLPWSSLKVEPKRGAVLGFQLVRAQNSPRQVSSWFLSYARTMNPIEFGHLVLE